MRKPKKTSVTKTEYSTNLFTEFSVKISSWQHRNKWELRISFGGFEIDCKAEELYTINTFTIPILFDSYQEALARGIMFTKQMNLELIPPPNQSANHFELFTQGLNGNRECHVVKFEAFQNGVFIPQYKLIHLTYGNQSIN